jgi:hypothetical protein
MRWHQRIQRPVIEILSIATTRIWSLHRNLLIVDDDGALPIRYLPP